jgi:hypothetical protein
MFLSLCIKAEHQDDVNNEMHEGRRTSREIEKRNEGRREIFGVGGGEAPGRKNLQTIFFYCEKATPVVEILYNEGGIACRVIKCLFILKVINVKRIV